jgi:hypothetical protein
MAGLPGLEEAVVRAWLMPEIDGEGTPAASGTPMAAPFDSATGASTVVLTIGAFRFDSEDAASAAFETLAQFAVDTSDLDPSFAGGSRVELPLGDQSIHASAKQTRMDVPFTYFITVVRQGTEVFLLQGTLIRLDPTTEATRLATALLQSPTGDGEMVLDPNGGSTGGLWDRFASVNPTILPGTTVMDTIIYPAPE